MDVHNPQKQPAQAERTIRALFEHADVQIGGSRPWDIQVHHDRMYARVLAYGSVGFGEAYMDGDWDCPALDQLFDRVITARIADRLGITLPLDTAVPQRPAAEPPIHDLNRVIVDRGGRKAGVPIGQVLFNHRWKRQLRVQPCAV